MFQILSFQVNKNEWIKFNTQAKEYLSPKYAVWDVKFDAVALCLWPLGDKFLIESSWEARSAKCETIYGR